MNITTYLHPIETRLVRDLIRAYTRQRDLEGPNREVHVGCSTEVMKKVVDFGLEATQVVQ